MTDLPELAPADSQRDAGSWRNAAGLVFVAVIGLFALRRPEGVPVLNLVNLGFHELGHLVTYPFPDLITAAMGSITQVLVPTGLAAYFWWLRRDVVGAGVCLGWAGTSAVEWARYVADAPYERLALIGGDHDWAFILFELDQLDRAAAYATAIRVVGALLVLAGLASCARPWWPGLPARARRHPTRRWVL
jgi:hypothetical protein